MFATISNPSPAAFFRELTAPRVLLVFCSRVLTQLLLIVVAIGMLFWNADSAIAEDPAWRAGVARVNITPDLPIWLSGYGDRNRPAAEKLDDLWAKALVLEDSSGNRAVLVTLDLVGVNRELSRTICQRIDEKYRIPRANIALCASHTHSGPIVRDNLAAMFQLDQKQTQRVKDYGKQLPDIIVAAVGDAVDSLSRARLSYATGTASFAVNRRNNPEAKVPQLRKENVLLGPVDHDVPVLAIHGDDGRLRAVVAGYACHATVLSGYRISADWPGVAQSEIERRHPGTIALYWAGCGGDQNPLPRRSVELMHHHGRALADAVDAALGAPLAPIPASLRTSYAEIELAFGQLPSRAELERDAAGKPPQSRWAKYMLGVWDRDGSLPRTYPYPVQAWHLGPDVTWLFLGGEVVVDYALRIKSEFGGKATWVTSYSNDVMGYIPSRRVLAEGGYEGGGARIPYGLPAVWDPQIEQQIVDAVHKVADQ
jgi:hypothetical protein